MSDGRYTGPYAKRPVHAVYHQSVCVVTKSRSGTTQYFATDENLSVGDSIGVRLWQSVGNEVQASVFLEIRRLGRRVGAVASPAAPEPADPLADTG